MHEYDEFKYEVIKKKCFSLVRGGGGPEFDPEPELWRVVLPHNPGQWLQVGKVRPRHPGHRIFGNKLDP